MFTYTPTVTAESDDSLRDRLLYLVDGERNRHEIRNADSQRLDEIASRYNLRRRRV